METILTILLVVGGILYKIYENYKEEMEKSRKRMQERMKQMQPPTPSPQQQPMKSARKQQEAEVRRGAELLDYLIHHSPSGFYIVDADFRISHINAGSIRPPPSASARNGC